MRQIGTINHEQEARRFSAYLTRQKIDNSIDASVDPVTENPSYVVWVHNEDQLEIAAASLERFLKNPSATEFDVSILEQLQAREEISQNPPEEPPVILPRVIARVTSFFIAFCAILFFLNSMQEISLREEGFSEENFLMTPLQLELLYDVPPDLDALEAAIEKYQPPLDQKIDALPPEIKAEINALERAPFFRGMYAWVVLKITGHNPDQALGPIFYKIRQGEIWRLFTPCILHAGLLHLGFNMLWLWILGRQIEQRIGWMRYLLLTLVVGIVGNTVQYIMSGPFFLGYSGIITGLAGFIWSRERIAPWEGYPLQRSMIKFLALFIIAMFALQFGSFLLLLFTSTNFTLNIANAAHIGGAIFGIFLGRLSFFDARGEHA